MLGHKVIFCHARACEHTNSRKSASHWWV